MAHELAKNYDPCQYEPAQARKVVEQKQFKLSDTTRGNNPFSLILPPPNATGTLHLGHAMMIAIQDIMMRFHRMKGDDVLWVPGTDHAAIATQSRVEKNLQEAGITNPRKELGREKLLEEIQKFVDISKDTIRRQVQAMGASCDWDMEAYTLDPEISDALNQVFAMMYEDGLIYQGDRIVNWDPEMQTTVSDDEIERIEEKSKFYYFQYGPFVIGTARPETKFGDKYVVMHPDDERYYDYVHGQTITLEWINGPLTATVIKDEAVDPEFGTGVMTITPWHDVTDFEMAGRHRLDIEQIIDFEGNLLPIAEEFAGMHIHDAREKIVSKLEQKGLLVSVEEGYVHAKAVNYRGKGTIEPQIMKQWFIDVTKPIIDWKGKKQGLRDIMIDVVASRDIEIIPDRFEKIYFNWIENLHDWCISRQIWWGHQVPIWYEFHQHDYQILMDSGFESSFDLQRLNITPIRKMCTATKPLEAGNWIQDPDTLDTWFSSGLWTFTSLGWPHNKDMLSRFHPTSVLETGYDILFFWVARMIMLTTYVMRREGLPEAQCIPFRQVYLHGLVYDRDGKKMSKSNPKTCIDPLDMIEKYGADALRLSLILGASPGNNVRLYEEKIAGLSNFLNKIWNIARFIETQIEANTDIQVNTLADRWILTRLQSVISQSTEKLQVHRFSEVAELVYHYLRDEVADWYLEVSKIEGKKSGILRYIFAEVLKLLHPFIPFQTDTLWKHMFGEGSELAFASWPEVKPEFQFAESEHFEVVRETISRIRREKAEFGFAPKDEIPLSGLHAISWAEETIPIYERLAGVKVVEISNKQLYPISARGVTLYLDILDKIDLETEKIRWAEDLQKQKKLLAATESKLSNEKFIENADPEIIEREKEKALSFSARIDSLEERLEIERG